MPKLCDFETCRNRATYGFNCDPIKCSIHKEPNMKLSCTMCKCGKQPIFNFKNMSPKFCSVCKLEGMIDVKNKKCFCEKSQPIYNFEGLKPNFCFECKHDGMINLVSKKCFCEKSQPIFNLPGLTPKYCINCKDESMIDVINKKCLKCNSKRPNYNFKGLTAKYCGNCKEPNMVDVNHNKCFCGSARPSFNHKGLKPEYCIKCKDSDMINTLDNMCICGKTLPLYNYEGLQPKYCSDCKIDENMVNVKNKKCKCGKINPIYNFEGLKPAFCSNCKEHGMMNLVSKKCFCKKSFPTYNFKGLIAEYCLSCKKDGMIDVNHNSCKAENCQTRGNKNYKGYCTNCFQHLFPTDPLTFQIRSKTKEIAVRDFINSRFEGFQHDKPLWYNESVCDCTTKRRIDHRKLINDTLLCIETDENQHKSYSKENEIARYNDLFMAFGGKFIFIRFNPDKYKDKNGKSCNPMLVNRLPKLEEEIKKQTNRIEKEDNKELLEVIELFYDKSI
jgi:hypothetical protein